jgi:hypothetical protein
VVADWVGDEKCKRDKHCEDADEIGGRRWQHQGRKRRHRCEVIAIGPRDYVLALTLAPLPKVRCG